MLALIPLSLEKIKFGYIFDKDKPENGISNHLLMDDLKLFCQEWEPDLWNDDIYCKKVGMVFAGIEDCRTDGEAIEKSR